MMTKRYLTTSRSGNCTSLSSLFLVLLLQLLVVGHSYRYNCDLRGKPIVTLELRKGRYVRANSSAAAAFGQNISVAFGNIENDEESSLLPETVQARYCPCWSPLKSDGKTLEDHVFYCPTEVSHCGIPTSFLSTSKGRPRCLDIIEKDRFLENIWPAILIAYLLLSFYLFCSAGGRNVFGFILNTCSIWQLYNKWVINRLIAEKPDQANRIILNHFRHAARQEQLRNLPSDWSRPRQQGNSGARVYGIRARPPEPRLVLTPSDLLLLLDDPTTNLRLGRVGSGAGGEEQGARQPHSLTLKTRIYKQEEEESEGSVPKAVGGDDAAAAADTNQDCTICYGYLEDGDRVGALPHCNHTFHVDCLKVWLTRRNVCPLCLSEDIAAPQYDEDDGGGGAQERSAGQESNTGESESEEDGHIEMNEREPTELSA